MIAAMTSINHLLRVARAYGAAEGIAPSTVSWRVFGDTKKLGALETGSDIQIGRWERAMQWFSDNWPAGTEWPAGIARPMPQPDQATPESKAS
jgi:hypothetical protein